MSTQTVTAKGQVTLSRDILKHLGVSPGEKIVVDKLPDGRVALKAAPAGNISDLFDLLKQAGGPSHSTKQIHEIAARAWAGKRPE